MTNAAHTPVSTLQSDFVDWPEVGDTPDRMVAMPFREFGAPEVLKQELVDTPRPQRGEVLVKVGAVSIGRLLDLAARAGVHPYVKFTLPHILGAEHGGTIAAVGEGVDRVRVGDRVGVNQALLSVRDRFVAKGRADLSPELRILGVHTQGAYAAYCIAPAENVTVVPDGVDPAQTAALAGVGAVAVNQFTQVGGVHAGMNVVVPAATSGLGSTTALLAQHLGANVVVTSRDEKKRQRLAELGFVHVLDSLDENIVRDTRDAFGGVGADLIVDNLGSPAIWKQNFDMLEPGGAIVSSGAFLGHSLPIDLLRVYSLGFRIIGVRSSTPEAVQELWQHVGNGFRTVVDRIYPLAEAPAAHRYMEDSGNVGRVVLAPEREEQR